jgi:hypothetical protein
MDQLFMTGRQVGDFIRGFALGRLNISSTNSTINELIVKLHKMESDALAAESHFYNMLNVDGLEALQARLDGINSDPGLRQLTNRGFRETDWGQTMLEKETSSTSSVMEYFNKVIDDTDWLDVEGFAENVANSMSDYYNKSKKEGGGIRAVNKGGGRRVLIKKEVLKQDLIEALKGNKEFSSTYARDLKTYLQTKEVKIKNPYEQEIDVTLTLPRDSRFPTVPPKNKIIGFPYYHLTPEEQKRAMGDNKVALKVWSDFVDFLSGGSQYSREIAECMGYMGKKAFVLSCGSFSDVIGILGELHAMVSLFILGNGNIPDFKGHDLEDGKKVNLDVLLQGFGFQVKNYYGYSGGYHIHESYTWKQLESRDIIDGEYDWIKQFYITQAFNQPNKKYEEEPSFKNYESFYQNFLDQKGGSVNNAINAYLAANLDKLIPLKRLLEISGVEEISANTVFWLFGGKVIIPTSVLCGVLRDRIEKFRAELISGSKTAFTDFRVNVNGSYSKHNIWDGTTSPPDGVDYSFVENALGGLHFDFNIYLSNLTDYIKRSIK